MEILRSVLVLTAAFGLLFVLTHIARELWHVGWRLSILHALVGLGGLVWLVTEALSALHAISLLWVGAAWLVVLCAAAFVLQRLMVQRQPENPSGGLVGLGQTVEKLTRSQKVVLGYSCIIALVLGFIALIAAPNTWDALTYHLSRVMHWEQDQSLHFYATSIQRQLSFGPWAEMAILNSQVLVGTDRLANLVQFAALIGCVIGISLIAERMGGDSNAQILAVLTSMTLPMAILQSTSTQNDLVTALWCTSFAVFCLTQMEQGASGRWSAAAGAALGLAILTKVTALLYTAPFGAWLAVCLVRRMRVGAVKPLLILLLVTLIIVAPQSFRNQSLYGNPFGTTPGEELGHVTNAAFSLPILASNVLRNLGSQLATPIEPLNRAMDAAVVWAHGLMRIDVNDPRTTWPGSQFQVFFFLHEDSVSNPLHLILILAAVLVLLYRKHRRTAAYSLCLLAGFLLLCLVVTWQPWASRLHMPLFLLAMPLVGVAFSRYLRGGRILLPSLLLAVAALPCLTANPARPLTGSGSVLTADRLHQYFLNVPDDFQAYDTVAQAVSGARCQRVGLITGFDGREYLAWVMIRAYTPNAQLQQVSVKNPSARYAADFEPCAIVAMHATPTRRLVVQNHAYDKVVSTPELELFLISDSVR
jgi:hypothetical protein